MRLLGILAVLLLSIRMSAEADVSVRWSENNLHELLCSRFRITKVISFTSNVNVSEVAVTIVPTLKHVVSVSPASFHQLRSGKTYSLRLTIAAPEDSTENVDEHRIGD